MTNRALRVTYSAMEITIVLLDFSGFLFLLSRMESNILPLNKFVSPMYFQFLILPVYMVLTYKHDLYFYSTYCCTRYSSERHLFCVRSITLVIETLLFYIPLSFIYWILAIHSRLPLARTVAFYFHIYMGLLLLGLLSTIFHQLTRSYLPGILLYILLLIDSAASMGALPLDISLFYVPLFQPASEEGLVGVYMSLLWMVLKLAILTGIGYIFSGMRGREVLV